MARWEFPKFTDVNARYSPLSSGTLLFRDPWVFPSDITVHTLEGLSELTSFFRDDALSHHSLHWALFPPTFEAAISHLMRLPILKKVDPGSIRNLPYDIFFGCISLNNLSLWVIMISLGARHIPEHLTPNLLELPLDPLHTLSCNTLEYASFGENLWGLQTQYRVHLR